ncbi:MAG: spore coat protein U domain-containing protein [Bacteriovoracaceae bacterium]|nr:spore coat protein U domain-containing protein [Bacteriovoracaceae bacterium]
MNNLTIAALITFFIIAPLGSQAKDCKIILSTTNIDLAWTNASQDLIQTIQIQQDKKPKKKCQSYFLTFSSGNSTNFDRYMVDSYNNKLPYNIYKNSGQRTILKDFSTGSNHHEFLHGNLANLAVDNKNFYLSLPFLGRPNEFPVRPRGIYSDTIVVSFYTPDNKIISSKPMTIRTVIPPTLYISLVDSGSPFNIHDTHQTLDYGELSKGQTKNFDIRVLSNAGYSLFFSSLNNGVLKHLSRPAHINYSLKVDNQITNLSTSASSPRLVTRRNGVTPSMGNLHQVMVTIGDVENKYSGEYTDYITMTIMALE